MSSDPGGVEPLLVASTFALGLRHGVDWDHLSAISDLTGADLRRTRAAMVAVLYALGHGAAVFALGALAVAAGERLPPWIDPVMERVVGATLLVLALAVIRSARTGGRPVARGVLLLQGLGKVRAQLRRQRRAIVRHAHGHGHDGLHTHTHTHPTADVASGRDVQTKHRHDHVHQVDVTSYGSGAAFAIGLLHGVGAETGTQAVVLAGAAHATATGSALIVVGAFVVGVVVTTVGLALASAVGWAAVGSHRGAVRVLSFVAAGASAAVGGLYLFGASDRLPSILTG